MIKTIAFFNSQAGVGTTSLIYHLGWMYADLGLSVLTADLDPQARLTAMFLDEARLRTLWPDHGRHATVFGALKPLVDGLNETAFPHVETISSDIGLLAGDPALAATEEEFSRQWSNLLRGKPDGLRTISACRRVLASAASSQDASLVLVDVGPGLDALRRAALIGADDIVMPLAPDLFSLQALRTAGPVLKRWRQDWTTHRPRTVSDNLPYPHDVMTPAGYIIMQQPVRLDRPAEATEQWLSALAAAYRNDVQPAHAARRRPDTAMQRIGEHDPAALDPNCVGAVRYYASLMSMAQEARKPMFHLKPADGAVGGHAAAVQDCYRDFRELARRIARRCEVSLP